MTQDLETQLTDQQTKLAELHAAFAAKLDAAAAAHKQQCAELSAELRVRERSVADKLRVAIELDAALKDRATALDRKEKALLEKHAAVRGAITTMVSEMENEAAARAR